MQTRDLIAFVRKAIGVLGQGGCIPELLPRQNYSADVTVRVTKGMRIYLCDNEVKARPMAKCILLLFLRHPEGIVLKDICDYRAELARYYSLVSRSDSPRTIQERVDRLIDICTNNLNLNISRANSAIMEAMGDTPGAALYTIKGPAGKRKGIRRAGLIVKWE